MLDEEKKDQGWQEGSGRPATKFKERPKTKPEKKKGQGGSQDTSSGQGSSGQGGIDSSKTDESTDTKKQDTSSGDQGDCSC